MKAVRFADDEAENTGLGHLRWMAGSWVVLVLFVAFVNDRCNSSVLATC